MADAYEELSYTLHDGVGVITLNRPERLNAWTGTLERNLKRAVSNCERDDAVRVLVITGAGRGFCAGADMQLLADAAAASTDAPSAARRTDAARPAAPAPAADVADASELDVELKAPFPGRFGYLLAVGKPVIAAINGPCAGIGLVLALYCDLRFASERALFTTAFAQRGLVAEHGISWLLPRLIGPSRALDLLLSARRFSGSEAAALGIVNQTFSHETFMADVLLYARHLAHAVSPRALRVMKAQIWQSLSQSFGAAVDIAEREMAKSFTSEDFQEGVAHFVEKRAARFTGR